MPHCSHDTVRARYGRRCGYCAVNEADAAGELTVDHFRPVSAGGDDADDNLVYCCSRCNLYKGDFVPEAADVTAGRRLLHPLLEDVTAHLRLDVRTGLLEPLTETGRFHATLLHLNRPALIEYRLRRQLRELMQLKQSLLEAENQRLRELIAAQQEYIACLERILGDLTTDVE